MEKMNSEGVVIHALPFRDYDCILTVFTPEEGLIKLFIRRAYSSQNGKGAGITTPLSTIDTVFSKGRGDLYTCHEITVANHHLDLRKNLPILNAACDMLQAITLTQQPGKAAPELYQLLTICLHKLPSAPHPQSIACSFKLKLLRYEGLLGQISHCCSCATPLTDAWLHDADVFCRPHAPHGSSTLTADERTIAEILAFSRDFTQLATTEVTSTLGSKITAFFTGQWTKGP